MTTDELVARASPAIGRLGWAFYFVPETAAAGERLGLDMLTFYFLGRGGVLGDAEAPVVVSAFGYFRPELVADRWDAGRKVVSPRDAGRAFMACCHDFGRRTFAGVDGLGAFCDAAGAVVDAAPRAGLALFAATAAEPLADDLPARAMQLVATLREFRGSAHLLAVIASGVEPRLAHCAQHPDMVEPFGWTADDVAAVTEADRVRLADAEALTDRLVLPSFAVLDEDGRSAMVEGLAAMKAALKPAP